MKRETREEIRRKRERLMWKVFFASIGVWAMFTVMVVWWVL